MFKTALITLMAAGAVLLAIPSSAATPAAKPTAAVPPTAATPAKPATPPQRLFVVIYRPGSAWKQGKPMAEQDLGAHGAFMSKLFQTKQLLAAGPLGAGDGGLAIVRAADGKQVQALIATDPAITSKVYVARIELWSATFAR